MIEKFSTGIEGLDQLTGGGFLRGSAYIVQGPPGAGKTILANQFCYAHVRAGGRALYMTLLAESSSRMLGFVSQMSFFQGDALPDSLQYLSGYGVLEREGLPGLLKLVQHELKRHRATAMVLDGTFVAQSVASEHDFRAFIHGLQGVAGVANAVLVMLTHQNRAASAPEHTMVDGWIELCHDTKGFQAYRTIEVKKHRGAADLSGKHRFRITGEGIVVFPRIECIAVSGGSCPSPSDAGAVRRLSIGQPDIDHMLCGGLPPGSATLVTGPSGAGKTTLAMHYLSGSSPQEPGVLLSFYESPDRLLEKSRRVGLDLGAAERDGYLHFLWQPPAGTIVDEVLGELVREVRKRKAKRVVVEGMAVIRDRLVIPERLVYLINALTNELTASGASVVYTAEVPNLGLEQGSLPSDEISAMVSNVLLLNAGHRNGVLHRQLSVVKLRDSDFDPRSREFHITDNGIRLGCDPRAAEPEDAT